jgi:hypothetical protein
MRFGREEKEVRPLRLDIVATPVHLAHRPEGCVCPREAQDLSSVNSFPGEMSGLKAAREFCLRKNAVIARRQILQIVFSTKNGRSGGRVVWSRYASGMDGVEDRGARGRPFRPRVFSTETQG